MSRVLNEGFSCGEKKRLETLHLRLLQQTLSVLDETDSGLDVDAIRVIAENISQMRNSSRSFLLITHYRKLLDFLKPDKVHLLSEGRIVKSGGIEIADQIEALGFDEYLKKELAA